MASGAIYSDYTGREVNPIAQIYLVPRLRISGAMPLLHYLPTSGVQGHLNIYLTRLRSNSVTRI
jgi:hypothetical protein